MFRAESRDKIVKIYGNVMNIEKIKINEKYNFKGNGLITAYIHDDSQELKGINDNLPCIIICPGGGYSYTSDRECEPIAIEFYNRHYNTFTLNYSCYPEVYPKSLTELACSLDYVRKNCGYFNINPEKIYLLGCSAGAHLVGNLANTYSDMPQLLVDNEKLDSKPNGVVMCYPVITPDSHIASFKYLLGDNFTKEKTEELRLDKMVNRNTPPTFIWTTANDKCVNPIGTILYTKALYDNKIKYECHIFPDAPHGISLADERLSKDKSLINKKVSMWVNLADEFLKDL